MALEQVGRGYPWLQVLSGAVLLVVPAGAMAEPYLAVLHGYKCNQCHTNPTGGGMRNRFGSIYSQVELPANTVSADGLRRFLGLVGGPAASDAAPESTFFSGYVTNFLGVGGDFRFTSATVIQPREDTSSTSFEVSEGNLYGNFELLAGVLSFYLDEKVAPGGASSQEAYGLVRGPLDSYLKLGRMNLPFGLRIEDDAAFIRELTGFNFGVQDVGLELGLEPGPLSVNVAVSNGTGGTGDDNTDKQYTAMAAYVERYWRLGAQATYNNAASAKRTIVGGFAAVNLAPLSFSVVDLGKVSVLAEVDYMEDELEELPGAPVDRQLITYLGVNYQLVKGLNLKFTYDYADPDTSQSDDSFIRVGGGAEYTVTQFVQLRGCYYFRDDTEDSPRDDESTILFEVHVFF
jgi:hypothetical protein